MIFRLSAHAKEELGRRGIALELLERVLEAPQQVIAEREGRKAYQSQVALEEGRMYLLRVIVLDSVEPGLVVTVYRTSRIEKYWRAP
jgi:hypothetical protein